MSAFIMTLPDSEGSKKHFKNGHYLFFPTPFFSIEKLTIVLIILCAQVSSMINLGVSICGVW